MPVTNTSAGSHSSTVSKIDCSQKLKQPNMFEVGASHKLDDQLTLVATALWTQWSSFKEMRVIAESSFTDIEGQSIYEAGDTLTYTPEEWKDTWSVSVGARYQLTPQWLLRCGYNYDESPVKNSHRSVRVPGVDRKWLTVGAHYQADSYWGIDMAYGYMIPETVRVDDYSYSADKSKDESSYFKGKYKMSAQLAMLSLTYQY